MIIPFPKPVRYKAGGCVWWQKRVEIVRLAKTRYVLMFTTWSLIGPRNIDMMWSQAAVGKLFHLLHVYTRAVKNEAAVCLSNTLLCMFVYWCAWLDGISVSYFLFSQVIPEQMKYILFNNLIYYLPFPFVFWFFLNISIRN